MQVGVAVVAVGNPPCMGEGPLTLYGEGWSLGGVCGDMVPWRGLWRYGPLEGSDQ